MCSSFIKFNLQKVIFLALTMVAFVQHLNAVEINTTMGKVDIPPVSKSNVVTLEHRYTEMVLSLGEVPIGVADIKSYQIFDGINGSQLSNVVDVGRRAAPSIETIARLNPNLIIGAKLRNANAYPILSRIAPTLLFSYIEPTKQKRSALAQMFDEFDAVAKALHQTKKAQEIIRQYNQTMAEAKLKITQLKAQGKLKNDRIAIAQFLPGSPKIRLFTTDSAAMEALNKIGLKPAWQEQAGKMGMGYLTVSTDLLAKLGNFHFFYFNERSDDSQLRVTTSLPVWQSFEFVKNGNTYELAPQSWPWGGPMALAQFITQIVNTLERIYG